MGKPLSIGNRVVAEAERWLGTPYHHAQSVRGLGCDCLGLVIGIWRALCGDLPETPPRYTPDWGEIDPSEPLLTVAQNHFCAAQADEQPGDLLIFRWRDGAAAKHAGIITSPGRIIHAYDGAGVVSCALTPAWRRRIAGRFSFPEVPE